VVLVEAVAKSEEVSMAEIVVETLLVGQGVVLREAVPLTAPDLLRVGKVVEVLLLLREVETDREGVVEGEKVRVAEPQAERLTVRQAVALREAKPLSVPEVLRVREVVEVSLLLAEIVAATEGGSVEVMDTVRLPLREDRPVRDAVAQAEAMPLAVPEML
jgi:hypothetical protein